MLGSRDLSSHQCRVSEPACFGAALASGNFYPEPAPGEREHNVGIFLTDYKLSKIRSKIQGRIQDLGGAGGFALIR